MTLETLAIKIFYIENEHVLFWLHCFCVYMLRESKSPTTHVDASKSWNWTQTAWLIYLPSFRLWLFWKATNWNLKKVRWMSALVYISITSYTYESFFFAHYLYVPMLYLYKYFNYIIRMQCGYIWRMCALLCYL